MDRDEIHRYCRVSGGVCVYRKRIRGAQFVVQSISLYGEARDPDRFRVVVELDALGWVGQGEGYRWSSSGCDLDQVIESLERYIGLPLAEWENVTRSGRLPHYDSEDVTEEHFERSWQVIRTRYRRGRDLLPAGLAWTLGNLSPP